MMTFLPSRRSSQSDDQLGLDPGEFLQNIVSSILSIKSVDMMEDDVDDAQSRTELDSHANMAVVGSESYIIGYTGNTVNVSPFTPDYEALSNIPVVDAAVMYECPYTGMQILIIIRDALYVPSMKNNLIPPFIIREAGVRVNDIPKIHLTDPTVEDHAIIFPVDNTIIPLKLAGTFSYFPTTKPTENQVAECEDIYLLTPESNWNPHSMVYSHNEDSMLDWKGDIKESRDRDTIVLDDIPEDELMVASLCTTMAEQTLIDKTYSRLDPALPLPTVPNEVSPIYDHARLSVSTVEADYDMRFRTSAGVANSCDESFLFDLDDEPPEPLDENIDGVVQAITEDDMSLDQFMASAAHARPTKTISPEHLSKVWKIDLRTAKNTLGVTSQHSPRPTYPKLSRNYTTNDRMLRYKRIDEYFFMDTFLATRKAQRSVRGNTCCQLFVTDKGFIYIVPMRTRLDLLSAVKQFAKEIGAPEAIICDHSGEQSSDKVKKFCQEIGTSLRFIEEGTPWANKAELYIGILKEAVRKDMKDSDCPLVLWDYCVERRARINNLTAKDLFQLHGTNAYTALTSEEGDISNLCQFGFYDWCYFREQKASFPFNKEMLGRVLGPAKGEGNEMAQWVLKANGRIVPRRTCRPLNTSELHSPTEKRKRDVFNRLIEAKLGTSINPPRNDPADIDEGENNEHEPYEDKDELPIEIPEQEDSVDASGQLLNQQPAYDLMINAKVQLQNGDDMSLAKVLRRAIGPDGQLSGEYNDNPRLNSLIYEVEFPDGQIKEYAANVIADNILRQVDHEGYSTTLMAGIIDYKKDESVAIPKSDKWVVTKRGGRRLRKSTAGWKLLVQWMDGSESWIPLRDMKESHPVETAEFAKAKGISDEAAFAYWVPYTLKKEMRSSLP